MKRLSTVTSMALTLSLATALGCSEHIPGDDVQRVSQMQVVANTSVGRGAPGLFMDQTGRHWMTYTGSDGRINVLDSQDNYAKRTLAETSIAGSAITQFGGAHYLAWLGTDGNRSLNIMTSADGALTWGNKQVINLSGPNHRPNAEPFFVVYGNTLNLFFAQIPSVTNATQAQWDAVGGIGQYLLTGGGWVAGAGFPGHTLSGPSAAVLPNNELVVGWTHMHNSVFQTRKFNPNTGWGGINTVVASKEGHLVSHPGGSVLWFSRNNSGSAAHRIEVLRSFDGLNFAPFKTTTHTSFTRPTATVFNPNGFPILVWSHVGIDPNRSLNIESMPGS